MLNQPFILKSAKMKTPQLSSSKPKRISANMLLLSGLSYSRIMIYQSKAAKVQES